jgi:TonB family protein
MKIKAIAAVVAVAIGWLATCVTPAATLQTATAAYERRDYTTAHREFLVLARVGNGLAQFNLGVMLLNGEGVKRSVREGYAWLLCAADHGIADARPLIEQIAAQVKPEVTERARGECVPVAGRESAKALMPPLPRLADWDRQVMPQAIGRIRSVFPDTASAQGLIGWVDTEITLGADGRIKDLWVVESFPEGYFEEAALDALRAQEYEPAKIDGKAAPVVFPLRFRFGYDSASALDIKGLEALLQRLEREAATGNAASQYVLYRLGEVFSELRERVVDWHAWGRKSLDAGFGATAFEAGYCAMMAMSGCLVADRDAGRDAIRRVAVSGGTAAQVALGRLALAERTEDGIGRARRWLEAAAIDGDRWAARYLAVALLSSSDPARRDGARALALAEPLRNYSPMSGDPSTWAIVAAAYAEAGRFADALKAQDRALGLARRHGWSLEELSARRKDYAEGRHAVAPPLELVALRAPFKLDSNVAIACDETARTGTRVPGCRD